MIRNDAEYQEAQRRLAEGEQFLSRQKEELTGMGLKKTEVARGLEPARAFHEQLCEEIESYERLLRGDFREVLNFEDLGKLLIALRLFRRVSQRELADRLGTHESQVSRDERNEYHGITVQRAKKVLDALGVEVRFSVVAPRRAKQSSRRPSARHVS